MTSPILESIARTLNYADLPETWRVPEIGRFSVEKTLYDYQTDALEKAAQALFFYYGKEYGRRSDFPWDLKDKRKQDFQDLYRNSSNSYVSPSLKKYESKADERNGKENQVFRILSDFITPFGDSIPYYKFINRMCFWMATGSGKTLVMVKLIEYLHSLKKHGEIPPHNILILAPSDHLIGQIRRTVDEFNQSGLPIDLVPLREMNRRRQMRLDNAITVYYHRSDNISDVQKDALTDYRTYENDGKWYVLLDEAHKGGKEESKRQAYYVVMTRNGFLFNFSATFTDDTDIITTVKKYNLKEFTKNGHGKNIYLNEREFTSFKNSKEEISHLERRKIVLKSLITLGYVSMRVDDLRKNTGLEKLYHLPLMLTLVNSVNTNIENDRNDLWSFFQTLREIATGEVDESIFKYLKEELIDDWKTATLLFEENPGEILGTNETAIRNMTIADVRASVFLSRTKGSLQFIRSSDNKELALQLINADSPFALIRIGDTSKWRNELLAGYEETTALQEKSFFDGLEQSSITILMGSRSFFESWDSNRPNVINFINIGGKDAKKFVVQSVGRGVRIETLPNNRKRLSDLLPTLQGKEKSVLERYRDQVKLPETLFLFATNRSAVKTVLEGLEAEKGSVFEKLEGLEKAQRPKINGADMPLLVPEYRDEKGDTAQMPFAMNDETRKRLKIWFEQTSDSVFAVRDGLSTPQISALRGMVANGIQVKPEKHYAMIPFLQNRLLSHLSKTVKVSDGVRKLDDEDIIHFREIRVHSEHVRELQDKVEHVKAGKPSKSQTQNWALQLANDQITLEEFLTISSGKDEENFKDLTIKKLLGHYYIPMVLGNEKAHYIQHIIKVKSEIDFLNALEKWLRENEHSLGWDAWMFSKLDESLDQVHIPYYDTSTNEYRRFLPDFVFWMHNNNEYHIVFVDPKGAEHTAAERKIDGYRELFEMNETPRVFGHGKATVQVRLLMFHAPGKASAQYRRYWTDNPGDIFRTA